MNKRCLKIERFDLEKKMLFIFALFFVVEPVLVILIGDMIDHQIVTDVKLWVLCQWIGIR